MESNFSGRILLADNNDTYTLLGKFDGADALDSDEYNFFKYTSISTNQRYPCMYGSKYYLNITPNPEGEYVVKKIDGYSLYEDNKNFISYFFETVSQKDRNTFSIIVPVTSTIIQQFAICDKATIILDVAKRREDLME